MPYTASPTVACERIRNISVFSRFALNALWFCSFSVAFFVSRFVVVESQVDLFGKFDSSGKFVGGQALAMARGDFPLRKSDQRGVSGPPSG